MLPDTEIKDLVDSGKLKIKPFEKRNLEPASYDLRVGRVLIARRGVVDLSRETALLRAGDWAEVESLESLEFPIDVGATVGVRTAITRQGLDYFSGPQVDPGYRGKIYISVFNASGRAFEFTYGMPFATLTFFKLSPPASRPYNGKYQDCFSFPEEDIQRMMTMEAVTLSDVIQSVSILEKTVEKLTTSIERMARDVAWVKNLLFAILIAMVIGLANALFQRFLK